MLPSSKLSDQPAAWAHGAITAANATEASTLKVPDETKDMFTLQTRIEAQALG
jgi:hypothetical protein